jgi:hypothetical protein
MDPINLRLATPQIHLSLAGEKSLQGNVTRHAGEPV